MSAPKTVFLGAFGATIALVDPPSELAGDLVTQLVGRTSLALVDGPADAEYRFSWWREHRQAELWSGEELLRRHLADTPDELITSIVGGAHHGVACHARGFTFVHAGAVAIDGCAVVIPGASHFGKSTLVRALVEAGAGYLSDEFAVLDAGGRVHPYRKPLSLRDVPGEGRLVDVEELGGVHAVEPFEQGCVISTRYEAGVSFEPEPMAPGMLALELVANTVTIQRKPDEDTTAIAAFVRAARGWLGPRGDADEAAGLIAELVRGASAGIG